MLYHIDQTTTVLQYTLPGSVVVIMTTSWNNLETIDSRANYCRATHFQNFFATRDREPSGRLFAGHLAMSKPIASHAARALRMPSSWNPLPHQAPPETGCDSKPFALHISYHLLSSLHIISSYHLFILWCALHFARFQSFHAINVS